MKVMQSFGSQPQGNMEGYHGSGPPINVSGCCGYGMGKAEMSKKPTYGEVVRVVSVSHGHKEVGPKI